MSAFARGRNLRFLPTPAVVLARIEIPVQVLRGRDSYPFAARAIQRWAERRANVRWSEVPGGHCFMQEDPDAAAGAVRGALLGSNA